MEAWLGHDLSDVRVHTGSKAKSSTEEVGARAYTVGHNVVLAGSYDPASPATQRLMAHELTHVVQQRLGPVDGTPGPGGIRLSHPGDRFEREAERVADAVAADGPPGKALGSQPLTRQPPARSLPGNGGSMAVQRWETGVARGAPAQSGAFLGKRPPPRPPRPARRPPARELATAPLGRPTPPVVPPRHGGLRSRPTPPVAPPRQLGLSSPQAAPPLVRTLGQLADAPARRDVLQRLGPADVALLQHVVGNRSPVGAVPVVPRRSPPPAVEPAPTVGETRTAEAAKVVEPRPGSGSAPKRGLFSRLKGGLASKAPVPTPELVLSRPNNPPGELRGPAPAPNPAPSAVREPVRPGPDEADKQEEVADAPNGQAESSIEEALADMPAPAVVTLVDFLTSRPSALPVGTAPVAGGAKVKLPSSLAKVVDLGNMSAPRELDAAQLQAWIGADGPAAAKGRIRSAEQLAKLVIRGKSPKVSTVAGRRTLLAANTLLSYFVYGVGPYDQAQALGTTLGGALREGTFDDQSPQAQAALKTIGYSPTLDRIEVFGASSEVDAVQRIVRSAAGGLEEQEKHVAAIHGVEVPKFYQLVPEASRSRGGQQVAQINRLAARIVWQYEQRPALGALPALPPALTEDSPILELGQAAQRYQTIVSNLQVQANRLLPQEMTKGKHGAEREAAEAKARQRAAVRGDLFAAGSGAQEAKGERYKPERIPYGLQQAGAAVAGPGRQLPPTETPEAELDAQHKAQLDAARTEMKDMLARKVPAFVVQRYASDVIDLLLKQFHLEALREMEAAGWGTPPTEYAFLALGSGGRQEHTSFGDLDFALAVGATKTKVAGQRTSKQYFQELGRRMAQKANGLGERGPAGQGGKERKGLRICEGGVFPAPSGQMPYGPEVLIGTPEQLAKVQRRPGFVKMDDGAEFDLGADAEVFDALREPRFAFGSGGGQALADSYQKRLSSTLSEPDSSGSARSLEAGRLAISDATKQADKLLKEVRFDAQDFSLNVKALSRPIQLWVKGMCLCSGVAIANTRARIQELQKRGKLAPTVSAEVLDAVDTIAGWRLKNHLAAMEQDDVVAGSSDLGAEFALSAKDCAKALSIVKSVFPELRRSAEALVRS